MGSLLPSLVAGWSWQRWISKSPRSRVSIIVVGVLSVAFFSLITRVILGEWFWQRWLWLGVFPLILCGLPIAYLIFSQQRLPNRSVHENG